MRSLSLNQLYFRFYVETDWLLDNCSAALVGISSHDINEKSHQLKGEMSIIRLQDAWARYCRELIIMSAGCQPLTKSGMKLSLAPKINRRSDVIPILLRTYKKAKYEPKWHVATECIDAANRLCIQNQTTITGAIGSVGSPAEELRNVRNFFAHRSEATADKIRSQFSIPLSSNIDFESLIGVRLYPGITRIEKWVEGLRLIAEAAIY